LFGAEEGLAVGVELTGDRDPEPWNKQKQTGAPICCHYKGSGSTSALLVKPSYGGLIQ
jgi:hypothetical protein